MFSLTTFHKIMTEVANRIKSGGLTDLPDANVVIKKTTKDRERIEVGLPGILIAPGNTENIPTTGGTNIRDDIGYPVEVMMFDAHRQQSFDNLPVDAEEGHPDQEYHFDDRLQWRDTIRKLFIRQRLTGVDTVFTCEVEPLAIVDANEFLKRNLWVSALVLRFWSREARL